MWFGVEVSRPAEVILHEKKYHIEPRMRQSYCSRTQRRRSPHTYSTQQKAVSTFVQPTKPKYDTSGRLFSWPTHSQLLPPTLLCQGAYFSVPPHEALTLGTVSKYSSNGLAEMTIITFSCALASCSIRSKARAHERETRYFHHGTGTGTGTSDRAGRPAGRPAGNTIEASRVLP